MNTSTYHYVHDSSYNLLASTRQGSQGDHLSPHTSTRLFSNPRNNQAVPDALTGNAFDRAGNMLQTPTLPRLSWDVTNMMQTTTQAANAQGKTSREFYTYTASLSRTRKVSETTNRSGNVIEITVSLYFGMVEKRSTYKGVDLSYDGVGVYDQGQRTAPEKTETDLRIMDMTGAGHRQVARQRTTVAHKERETTVEFCASNHIDSDQLRLSVNGEIVSYQNYRPFGAVACQYGATRSNHYGYSGQETDVTGLSYYGSRYYCPGLRRWLSCDKAGDPDHTLNRYAFVRGNPITFRDVRGFWTKNEIIALVVIVLVILCVCAVCACLIYMEYCQLRIRRPVRGEWHVYQKRRGSLVCNIGEKRLWFYHGNDHEGQRIERMIRTTGKETLESLVNELNKNTLAPELGEILREGFGTQYAKVLDGIKHNFNKIYSAFSNDALELRPYGSHLTKDKSKSNHARGVTIGRTTRLSRGDWWDTKTKSYATLEQVSDPEKISSDIKYDRHTDDDLLFAAFHELFHNDTGAGIKDHHYAYHKLTWKGVIKDSENNVIRHTETVALDHLNPKKTVENPDSYAYVAIVWKDCMENKKNLPIRSTLTKSQVAPVEMENIVNDPDIKIIYDRLKSQKD